MEAATLGASHEPAGDESSLGERYIDVDVERFWGERLTSELRKDPILGRWGIIAGGRSRRPNPFRHYTTTIESPDPCPFCPGNETLTPPEVLVYRVAEGEASSWKLREVPNLFPALRFAGDGGAGGIGEVFRVPGALHLLRHPGAGAGRPAPGGGSEPPLRGHRPVRVPLPVRDQHPAPQARSLFLGTEPGSAHGTRGAPPG